LSRASLLSRASPKPRASPARQKPKAMRVIAGRLGGRSLSAPRGLATRPTSDRVREALFSILGDVSGAVVLDLYAGTGALGIEALSRGASRAVFVESARPALAVLRQNLNDLGLTGVATVLAQPVERARDRLLAEQPFDLVLADPPYAAVAEAAAALGRLAAAGPRFLNPEGKIVLEHAGRDAPPDVIGLVRTGTRSYGEASLTFYELPVPAPGEGML
jgi:16S rRNA (guanine966-N2)-methyltransferase